MSERIIADGLVLIHLGFICFVVFGGILVMRWKWIGLFHLPAVVWGSLIEFQGWICPLTPLEQHFRHLAGQSGYSGGFIEHYLIPLIYPNGLTPPIQMVIGLFVIAINMIIYGRWVYHLRKARK